MGMSMMFIDVQVGENCWNLYDSYGEICVHCGCCSKDKAERYKARIATIKGWLEEKQSFEMWDDDPELKALQERNVKSDIKTFKRMLRYYRAKLNEVTA